MGFILALIFIIAVLVFLTSTDIIHVSANADNAYDTGKTIFDNIKETVEVWMN